MLGLTEQEDIVCKLGIAFIHNLFLKSQKMAKNKEAGSFSYLLRQSERRWDQEALAEKGQLTLEL